MRAHLEPSCAFGGGIQIGFELRKSGQFSKLGKLQFHLTGHFLVSLHLCRRTNPRYGQTNRHCGTYALVEQIGLEKNLPIGNGNDIGGDVARDVSHLRFNDGQSSEGTVAAVLVETGRTLEEP